MVAGPPENPSWHCSESWDGERESPTGLAAFCTEDLFTPYRVIPLPCAFLDVGVDVQIRASISKRDSNCMDYVINRWQKLRSRSKSCVTLPSGKTPCLISYWTVPG